MQEEVAHQLKVRIAYGSFSVMHELKNPLQSLFAAIQLYVWSLYLVKMSLLLQYRRVFNGAIVQRVSLTLIVFTGIWNITQSVLQSFTCIPAAAIFPAITDRCLDSLTIWYIAAAFNITTDFCVLLLPLPSIKSLQLPLKQKLLLSAVLGLGFL
jgi:hypothetical protein